VKSISIIGAGGHSRSSINLLKNRFPDIQMTILDDSYQDNINEYIHDIKLSGSLMSLKSDTSVFLSIGDNILRGKYFSLFNDLILKENLFHNSAIIENNCLFGVANQIYANTYINSYCVIGDNNIINTSSVVEHEVQLGSHNYISIGAKIAGRVVIGNNCYIGANAIILENITICDDVKLGAGCVVTKNISKAGTYAGIPARNIT
jgi:UDP-N-acetylbacillosamine N-acetyltransferase